MKLSIILPTYNEKEGIIKLVNKILLVCRNNCFSDYEIIIVDDNSPDKTANHCRNQFKEKNNIRVFKRKKNRSLAKSIKHGIEKAKGEYLVIMDSDFNHDPQIIPVMLKLINNYDVVIGSRFINHGGMENKQRYYLSKLYNLLLKVIFRSKLHDFLSGFFCVKKSIIKDFLNDEIFNGYGEYFMKLLNRMERNDLKIKEIPVFYINRKYGKSKSRFLSMLLTYSKSALKEILMV